MEECPFKAICRRFVRTEGVLSTITRQYKTSYEIAATTDIPFGSVYRLMRELKELQLVEYRKRRYGNRNTSQLLTYQAGNPIVAEEYKSVYKR